MKEKKRTFFPAILFFFEREREREREEREKRGGVVLL